MSKFKILLIKDIKSSLRNIEIIGGVVSFNFLITILVSLIYRSVQVELEEISIFCLPIIWIIFILSIMKFVLQFLSEEGKKRIFLSQIRDGYSSREIFLSKLFCIIVVGSILAFMQISLFTIFLGFTQNLVEMIIFLFLCLLSLPSISAISIISVLISQRSSKEELLMPILSLPLLILISISVLNFSQSSFESGVIDYQNYWFKVILSLQIIYVILCDLLFSFLCRLKIN